MTIERSACNNGGTSLQSHWVRVPALLPQQPNSVSMACRPQTETTNGKVPHGKGNKRRSHQAVQPHRDDVALPPARGSDTNINKKFMKSSGPTNSLSSWALGSFGKGGVSEPRRLPHPTPITWMKKSRPREEEQAAQTAQRVDEIQLETWGARGDSSTLKVCVLCSELFLKH